MMLNYKSLVLASLMAAAAAPVLPDQVLSAQDSAPASSSQLSDENWNAWRMGIFTAEEADAAFRDGKYVNAVTLYKRAAEMFRKVQREQPDWNPASIASRISSIERKVQLAEERSAAQKAPGSLDQKIADANANAVQQIAELQMQLENLKKQSALNEQKVAQAVQTAKLVEELLNEKAEMEKKYSILLLQLNEAKKAGNSAQDNQLLQTALTKEKQRADQLDALLKKLQQEIAPAQAELKKLSVSNAELQKANAELKKRNEGTEKLEKEIDSLRKELRKSSELAQADQRKLNGEIRRLATELAKKSKAADDANEALTKLRSNLNLDQAARLLEQNVATLRAENDKLQKEIERLNADVEYQKKVLAESSGDLARSQDMVKNLRDSNDTLTGQLKNARKELDENRKNIKAAQDELVQLRAETARLREERNLFAQQLSKTSATATTGTEAELAQARVRLNAIMTENNNLVNARKKLELDYTAAKEKSIQLENTLKQTEESLKEAEAKVKALTDQDSLLGQAQEKIKRLELAVKTQTKLIADRNQEINKLSADLTQEKTRSKSVKPLEEKLEQLQTEKAALTKKLADTEKELAATKKVIADAKLGEREKLEAALKDVRNELATAKKVIADAKLDERAKLEKALKNAQSELDTAKKKIAELKDLTSAATASGEELRKLRETILVLEAEKAALNKEKQDLKTTISYHERRAKEYDRTMSNQALLKSVLQENSILKVELEEAKKIKLDKKTEELLAKAKADIAKYLAEAERNQSELRMVKSDQLQMRVQMSELEKQLSEAKKENQELRKDPAISAEAQKRKLAEVERKNLLDKVAKNEKEIENLEKLLAEAGKKDAAQTHMIALLNKEKKELQDKLDNMRPAIKTLEEKISAMEKKAGEDLRKYENLVRECDALKQQLKSNDALALSAKAELEKKIAALEKELAAAKANVKVETKTVTVTKADDARVKELSNRIAALEKELTQTKSALEQREKDLAAVRRYLVKTTRTMESVSGKADASETAKKLAELQQTNLRLNEQVNALNTEKNALGETLTQLRKELLAAKAEVEKLRVKIAADERNKELIAELKAVNQKVSALDKDLNDLKQKHQTLLSTKEQLQNDLQKTRAELDARNIRISALESDIRKWESGSEKVVKAKLADKDKVIDQVLKEHQALRAEIERLKAERDQANTQAAAAKRQLADVRKNAPATPVPQTTVLTTGNRINAAPAETQKKNAVSEQHQKDYNEAMNLAKKFEAEKDYDQAVWKYLVATDYRPDAWEPRMALAKLYLRFNKKDLAKKEYERALQRGAKRDQKIEDAIK